MNIAVATIYGGGHFACIYSEMIRADWPSPINIGNMPIKEQRIIGSVDEFVSLDPKMGPDILTQVALVRPSLQSVDLIISERMLVTNVLNEIMIDMGLDIPIYDLEVGHGEVMAFSPNLVIDDWVDFTRDISNVIPHIIDWVVSNAVSQSDSGGQSPEVESQTLADLLTEANIGYDPGPFLHIVAAKLPDILIAVFGDMQETDATRFLRKCLSVGVLSNAEEAVMVLGLVHDLTGGE